MAKIIVHVMVLILIPVVSVLTMIYGWGLQVESWDWVIGGYLATIVLPILSALASKDLK